MSKINWQEPFVNVFKHFAIETDKNANKSGDVTTQAVRINILVIVKTRKTNDNKCKIKYKGQSNED